MSAISQKSITGITSITTPAGVDNQLTLHNNNTTEAVKLDGAGNLHFHNHLNITGVSTASNFKTGTSNLHNTGLNVFDLDVDGHTNLDNVSIAGVTTTTGNLRVTDGFIFIAQSSGPQLRINSSVGDSSATRFILGLATASNGFINGAQSNDACITAPQEIKFGIGNNLKYRITNTNLIANTDLIPSANDIRSLGNSNYRWSDLFAVDANISGDLDVDGHTNLDNVSVAGVTTFAQKINLSDNFIRNCRGFNSGNEQARIVVKAGDNSAGGGLRIVEYYNDDTTLFSSEIANFYTTGIELKENVSITGNISIPLGTTTRIGVADRTSGTGAGGSLCVTAGSARGSGQNSGDLILASGRGNNSANAGAIKFGYNNGADGTSLDNEWLRIDNNGMIGFGGVTPKTQNALDAFEFGLGGLLGSQRSARTVELLSNAYYNSGWKYMANDVATQYYQYNGYHAFTTATSGSADAAISFTERLRITSNGGTLINKGGTVNSASGWAGLEVKAGYAEHQLVLSSTATASNSNQARLGFKLHPSNDNERVKAAIVCQGSGGGYGEVSRMMFCLDSVADNGSASPNSVDEKLRIMSTGELIIYPTTGGNQNTSIHFNNSASTPYITFKSNNLSESAHIKAGENNGGCDLTFKTKNQSGTSLDRLTIKNNGGLYTHQLAGNEKGYPIIMATDTVANNTQMSGSFNYHDFMCASTGGGNNYQIGGWVFLGNDYGPNPYPARRFQIAKPGGFTNGTLVYQVWHNGDSNYLHGGLWEIRINCWTGSSRFESVAIRCVNGSRDDMRVVAYNDSKGIMIQPSSIWGQVFIRKAGWDDGGRNPGSSYCAVANNGALAIYNSYGTDDGSLPSGGVDLYSFDGTSGSASATHTGGYYIENGSYFDG